MFLDFSTVVEVQEEEVFGIQDLMNESMRLDAETEAADELEQLADDLEVNHADTESELIENLRYTAQMNPLSETAFDLRREAFQYFL